MVYLEAHLDYETSERAGAGGMFQVISIEDSDGNKKTDLVDVGTHYSSLDDLKADLAKALGVPPTEIDLKEV
jgi:type I restriction enzyme S subunit